VEQISRIRQRHVVFRHIYASYGREVVILDGVQRAYEELMTGRGSWGTLTWMELWLLWAKVKLLFRGVRAGREKVTTFVNAAVVGGPKNELRNAPIVVEP
jgi:hypothetical protein